MNSRFKLQLLNLKNGSIEDREEWYENERTYKRITKGGQRVRSESTDTYVTIGECTIFDSAIPLSLSLFEVRVYLGKTNKDPTNNAAVLSPGWVWPVKNIRLK